MQKALQSTQHNVECSILNTPSLPLSIPLTHLIAYLLVYRDENRLHTDSNKCIWLTMNAKSIRTFAPIQNVHFNYKLNYIDDENVQFFKLKMRIALFNDYSCASMLDGCIRTLHTLNFQLFTLH